MPTRGSSGMETVEDGKGLRGNWGTRFSLVQLRHWPRSV